MSWQFYHDDAVGFGWIGASDDGDCRDVASVHRQVRSSGWYVHEVPGAHHGPLDQSLTMPDLRFTADGVDRALVTIVVVRQAAGARRDHDEVQAQRLSAGRPVADSGREACALLAVAALARADDHAVTARAQVGASWRAVQPLFDLANSKHLPVSHP